MSEEFNEGDDIETGKLDSLKVVDSISDSDKEVIRRGDKEKISNFFGSVDDGILDVDAIINSLSEKNPELIEELGALKTSLSSFNTMAFEANSLPEGFSTYSNRELPKRMTMAFDTKKSEIAMRYKGEIVCVYRLEINKSTREVVIVEKVDDRDIEYTATEFIRVMSDEQERANNFGVLTQSWDTKELQSLSSQGALYKTASYMGNQMETAEYDNIITIEPGGSKKLTHAETSSSRVTINTLLGPDGPDEVLITNTYVSSKHKQRLASQGFGDVVRAKKTPNGYVSLSSPESRPWLFTEAVITNLDTVQKTITEPRSVDVGASTLPIVLDEVDDNTLEECISDRGRVSLDYRYTKTPDVGVIVAEYSQDKKMFVDSTTQKKVYIWDGIMVDDLPEKEAPERKQLVDQVQGSVWCIDELVDIDKASSNFSVGLERYKDTFFDGELTIKDNSWGWNDVYIKNDNIHFSIDDRWEAPYHQDLSVSLSKMQSANDPMKYFQEELGKIVTGIVETEYVVHTSPEVLVVNNKTPKLLGDVKCPEDPDGNNYKNPDTGCTLCSKAARETAEKMFGVLIPQGNALDALGVTPTCDHYLDPGNKCECTENCKEMGESNISKLLSKRLSEGGNVVDVGLKSLSSENGKKYGHRISCFHCETDNEWYFIDPVYNYGGGKTYDAQPIRRLAESSSLVLREMRHYDAPVAVV